MSPKGSKPLSAAALLASGALVALAGSVWSAPDPKADASGARPAATGAVSALGRIEPEHGIRKLGAPSTPASVSGAVLKELLVEVGDDVRKGQLLAVMETANDADAGIAVSQAQLTAAEREADAAKSRVDEACTLADVSSRTAQRREDLMKKGLAAKEEADLASSDARAKAASCTAARSAAVVSKAQIEVARATLAKWQADLERTRIRAPMDARVIAVTRRPGELVMEDGVLELANVAKMYAIAEVFETDVRRLKVGQKATVTSRALDKPLSGTVERVRQKVRKQDQIGTDPAAQKDARIVEVEVLLDTPQAVASLSNLQVEIVIKP